jgi:Tfp pilus assembly protein PilO
MKWLPKEKRNPFMLVVAITVTLLLLIYFVLIREQSSTLKNVAAGKNAAAAQLQGIEKTIKEAELATNELAVVSAALTHAEEDIASGDLYSWAYNTLRVFKQPYKVEIPEIGHPIESEVDLIPSFPYRQMKFTVSGKGYYHDIGKFVSDFENNFPHVRIVNLTIEQTGSDSEKLAFRMDIIALIKPNAS